MPLRFKSLTYLLSAFALLASAQAATAQGLFGFPLGPQQETLDPIEQLGRELFNDTNLSTPVGQACASCHAPEVGFVSPTEFVNQFFGPHFGALPHRFGPRKPPSAAYAGDSPDLRFVADPNFAVNWEGGVFWDGRAAGYLPLYPESDDSPEYDPLAEQALFPFLNPVEQNIANTKIVVRKVAFSRYRRLFLQVWGEGSLDFQDKEVVARAYDRIVTSIAAFERSSEVNPYTSKFDAWLAGEAELTEQEKLGLWLFESPFDGDSLLSPSEEEGRTPFPRGNQGKGRCGVCHSEMPGVNGEPPLFTDFAYHNLGLPKNPNNPFYFMPKRFNPDGADFIDRGLAPTLETIGQPDNWTPSGDIQTWQDEIDNAEGRHKTPTLRNVNKRPFPTFVKAYMHNGVLKSMKDVVHFYNTRDVPEEGWDAPEVDFGNITAGIAGDLGLTPDEEDAIVAFLATLSDGYEGGGAPPQLPQLPPIFQFPFP